MVFTTIQNEEKYKEACENYKPIGRKIKVRDMRPGYVYTFADCSIEDYIQYGPSSLGYSCSTTSDGWMSEKEREHFLDNMALMQRSVAAIHDTPGKYVVQLDPVSIGNHYKNVLDSRCSIGYTRVATGRKVWEPAGPNYRIRRVMELDDDIIEVKPFRIGIYKGDNEYFELIPDPDKWVEVPADTPHTKEDDYVDVWDESDVKIIIVLSIISLVMFLGGPGAWSMIAVLWIFAALGFHKKHKEIKDQVLEERRRRGVRGNGLDDNFRRR